MDRWPGKQKQQQGLINSLSYKVSYACMRIDPVNIGYTPNKVRSHLRICDHSIITFGKIRLCLGFSNNSHVEVG